MVPQDLHCFISHLDGFSQQPKAQIYQTDRYNQRLPHVAGETELYLHGQQQPRKSAAMAYLSFFPTDHPPDHQHRYVRKAGIRSR
jgi:hypothetical protein